MHKKASKTQVELRVSSKRKRQLFHKKPHAEKSRESSLIWLFFFNRERKLGAHENDFPGLKCLAGGFWNSYASLDILPCRGVGIFVVE